MILFDILSGLRAVLVELLRITSLISFASISGQFQFLFGVYSSQLGGSELRGLGNKVLRKALLFSINENIFKVSSSF